MTDRSKFPSGPGTGAGGSFSGSSRAGLSNTAKPSALNSLRPSAVSALNAGSVSRQQIAESLQKIDTGTREFEFTAQDFERVRALIYKHAGISLSPVKQDMVYSRLARRLRAKEMKRFTEYLDYLERCGDPSEWEAFVNALTTNLTSFFREAHHFELLADQMRRSSDRRPFRIWCSAASTGEEPYSLAITACEVFGNNPPVEIIASDLDTNVLAHGQKGVYSLDRIERMSKERVQRFFLRGTGDQEGHVRVRPELTRLITFKQINLLDPKWALREGFDAMFCRNVMIYFDKPTQYKILERFSGLLHPNGLLYAGHSENFIHAAKIFRSLGRTVYARADQPVK